MYDYAATRLDKGFGSFQLVPFKIGIGSANQYGNLEVSPPTTVVDKDNNTVDYSLGRVIYGTGMDDKMVDFLNAQRVQAPFSIDTSWLYVGHVDEVLGFVPNKKAGPKESPYKVLMPSPTLAQKILEDLKANDGGEYTLFTGKKWPDPQDPNDPAKKTPAQITVNEALATKVDWEFNKAAQEKINGVRDTLKSNLGLKDADFIEVPVIFRKVDGRADAMSPNLVNLLAYNDNLIFPDPFGPTDGKRDFFQQYILDNVQVPLGIKAHFLDDWDVYHVAHGEVHCATNVLRAPLASPWWNQGLFI